MDRTIHPQRWYSLVQLGEEFGIPVSLCPEQCGGVRFQCHPNASCRNRSTCWMSRSIPGTALIQRCRQLYECIECRRFYRYENKNDIYCSAECEGQPARRCAICTELLPAREMAQKQLVSGRRAMFRRGPADTFPYTTFTVPVHRRCLSL